MHYTAQTLRAGTAARYLGCMLASQRNVARLTALTHELLHATSTSTVLAAAARAAADLVASAATVAISLDSGSGEWCVEATGDGTRAAELASEVRRRLHARATPPAGPLGGDHDRVLRVDLDSGKEVGGTVLEVVWSVAHEASDSEKQLLEAILAQAALALSGIGRADMLHDVQRQRREHDEFVSIMSHDLRTPLTSIRGYAQLSLRQARAPEQTTLRKGLETIMQQVDRLAEMTDILLDVARIRTGRLALHRTAADLGQVVRAVIDGVQQRAQVEGIRVEGPDTGPIVHADLNRLKQVVGILAAFALERCAEDEAFLFRIAGGDGLARLDVEDRGPVLEASERDGLFDQLVVLSEDGQGRAVGRVHLIIARGVVEAHGGRMQAASPVDDTGVGAQLSVWFPLHERVDRTPAR